MEGGAGCNLLTLRILFHQCSEAKNLSHLDILDILDICKQEHSESYHTFEKFTYQDLTCVMDKCNNLSCYHDAKSNHLVAFLVPARLTDIHTDKLSGQLNLTFIQTCIKYTHHIKKLNYTCVWKVFMSQDKVSQHNFAQTTNSIELFYTFHSVPFSLFSPLATSFFIYTYFYRLSRSHIFSLFLFLFLNSDFYHLFQLIYSPSLAVSSSLSNLSLSLSLSLSSFVHLLQLIHFFYSCSG